MIRYVKLVNYKSLVNLQVDFMKTKTKAKKLILIYGENGVGKSNFATSFYTLSETMNTMSSIAIWKKLVEENVDNFKEVEYKEYKDFVEKNFKHRFKDTEMIIKDCKTINSTGNMILEYGFVYKGKNGIYHIEMDDKEIVSERLEYVLNKNQSYYFDINFDSIKINTNIFMDKDYYNEFYKLLEKYWGKHSFLSILSYEIGDKKRGYVKKRISNNLYGIVSYLKTMCTKVKGRNHSEFGIMGTQYQMMGELIAGKISVKKEDELNKTETVLNDFFTTLYSDIKKVYYEKRYKDNYIHYELMIKKLIYGNLVDINFDLESTGTRNILDLFPYLISACEGQTVIIDELDTGIHDLMIHHLLENISPFIKGQMIITTHNTMLMESNIPKENVYVFNVNRNAEKELLPITDFNGRIHKNINPRKKYLNGIYGGIPIVSDIDFEELIDNLN